MTTALTERRSFLTRKQTILTYLCSQGDCLATATVTVVSVPKLGFCSRHALANLGSGALRATN